FLLKKGRLQAIRADKEKTTVLGEILPGEFVGEMAHITGESRSADVLASENSELVEIPVGTLDILLFSKPAWSRALMKTLAQRLRVTNTKI
ncbi:MAG TPA: Crp/Fnr family transcriptional regulator, partial [Bdellovibrionota bacterium]